MILKQTPWEEYRPKLEHEKRIAQWEESFSKMHKNYLLGAPRVLSNKQIRIHQGIDIYGEKGLSVVSMFSGKVIFSGELKGFGKTVIIKNRLGTHNYSIIYAHLDFINVREGTIVIAGQEIGKLGESGISIRDTNEIPQTPLTGKTITGPHLHLEILEDVELKFENNTIYKNSIREKVYSSKENLQNTGIFNDWYTKEKCVHPSGYILINPINWQYIKNGDAVFPIILSINGLPNAPK
ncbi:M23 family metallopeptidase [Candidatus Micrarchaeota archaeon]|jgi:murein DD-endopeptidase MepM/ murein hydrolase activator NlpD|nr:M23 family metallopeptidase [Candidatus Micrarchaeota archaeon]